MAENNFAPQQGFLMRGLLTLVHEVGGYLDGRVRLQKVSFFLKCLGVPDFRSATYRYHYYGPYSRELSDEIHNTVLDGLLEEIVHPNPEDPKSYAYRLTEPGKKWLENASIDIRPFKQFGVDEKKLDILKKGDSKQLELAATVVFLRKQDKNLTTAEKALERALELKPHCISVKGGVLQMLDDLGVSV